MKANELRIGSLVQFDPSKDWANGGADIEVESIATDGINIGYEQYVGRTIREFKDIAPIPLTELWLLKFGFESNGAYFTHSKEGLFELGKVDMAHIWDGAFTGSPCKYVHQLQNLYFALTGEELKIV